MPISLIRKMLSLWSLKSNVSADSTLAMVNGPINGSPGTNGSGSGSADAEADGELIVLTGSLEVDVSITGWPLKSVGSRCPRN